MSYVDWIAKAHAEVSRDELASLPNTTLYALYPEIARFGPNGANVARLWDDLTRELDKLSSDERHSFFVDWVSEWDNSQTSLPEDHHQHSRVYPPSVHRNIVYVLNRSRATDFAHIGGLQILLGAAASDGFMEGTDFQKEWFPKYAELFRNVLPSLNLDPDAYWFAGAKC